MNLARLSVLGVNRIKKYSICVSFCTCEYENSRPVTEKTTSPAVMRKY